MSRFQRIVPMIMVICIIVSPSFYSITAKTYQNQSQTTYLFVGGYGPGNFSSIQSAIDNASDGNIIYVYSGTYYEHLHVNKSVIFIAENKTRTIVDGQNRGDKPCFAVHADHVEIHNFTIVWSDWEFHEPGIRIFSNYVLVKNCNITHHDKGIILYRSAQYCTIEDNLISGVFEGIYLWIPGSHRHLIRNNIIKDCTYGIKLVSSTENTFHDNHIDNAGYSAIVCEDSDRNTFYRNTFQNSSRGITLVQGSKDNRIYHNNFINNVDQAISDGVNIWDDGSSTGGNFWDDYDGEDLDSDGLGDDPYYINNGNQDNHPHMVQDAWTKETIFNLTLVCPDEEMIKNGVQFTVIIEDGLAPFQYAWDFGDTHVSTDDSPTHNYAQPGVYQVSVRVTDALKRMVESSKEITIYPVDVKPPIITIISPKPGVYVNNNHILSLSIPWVLVIGPINIEISTEDMDTRVTRLDVSIGDTIVSSTEDSSFSYSYLTLSKGCYPLSVTAVDFAGNKASETIHLLMI